LSKECGRTMDYNEVSARVLKHLTELFAWNVSDEA
jgi:hypothetical protein